MSHSIRDIAAAIGAVAEGNLDLRVEGAAEPAVANADQIALAMDPRYADGLAQGHARCAVLWADADWMALGLEAAIFVPRSRLAMSGLTRLLDAGPLIAPGIHPMADIDPSARIGPDCAIGPFVTHAQTALSQRLAGVLARFVQEEIDLAAIGPIGEHKEFTIAHRN